MENYTQLLLDSNDLICPFPSYFVHAGHLILLAVASVVQLEFVIKSVVIIVTSAVYSCFFLAFHGPLFDHFDEAILYGSVE